MVKITAKLESFRVPFSGYIFPGEGRRRRNGRTVFELFSYQPTVPSHYTKIYLAGHWDCKGCVRVCVQLFFRHKIFAAVTYGEQSGNHAARSNIEIRNKQMRNSSASRAI